MKVTIEVEGTLSLPDHIFFLPGSFKPKEALDAQHLLCARTYMKRWPGAVATEIDLSGLISQGSVLLTKVPAVRTDCKFESLLDAPYIGDISLPLKTLVENALTILRNDAQLTRKFAERTYVLGDMVHDNYNLRHLYGTIWREIMYGGTRFVGLPNVDSEIGRMAIGWVQSEGR